MEQEKNILVLSVATGLSVTNRNINMINTVLVGSLLATYPSYATLTLLQQFMTIAITLIFISLLMGKLGRRPMFLIGAMTALFNS